VLWQTGAQTFSYMVISADGTTLAREVYDNFKSRPRLSVTTSGDVVVLGGVRRIKLDEVPAVSPPLPPPAASPLPPSKP